ncbi:MAG TPA: polymer-forming cytoskeletal protein [Candidatus Eisenbacteria bacterium]|nr:polymer-forming cytoskeletal protein [Candidatus Eisenbacteria bacterium]
MLRFRPRNEAPEEPPTSSTVLGTGANFRGTLMVSGVLRIDGEFEGDILHCDRLEIGEHGVMRSDVEVQEALIQGRVFGNVRAHGKLEMKAGARVEGDIAAMTVIIEPGVFYSGRCTMLEHGNEPLEMDPERSRAREHVRD